MTQVGFGNRVKIRGSEENPSKACGAVLEINAGKKSEMMFHLKNDKVLYVLVGKINIVVIQDGALKRKEFDRGESVAINPGFVHQIEAIEDSIVVEFGTNPEAYTESPKDTVVIEKGTHQGSDHNVITTEDKVEDL